MSERYIKLQIECVVNKLLYQRRVIEKEMYEEVAMKLDRLLFKENQKGKEE